jgi:hypothetical protein
MFASGVQRLSSNNRFCGPLAFSFVASSARFDSHENMKLRANPLSRPYVEYLMRVSNGEESSIIDHFPLKVDAEPLVEVEIVLYPEIHQAPSLDIFIHAIFPTLAINYTNQGYMDDQTILTTKNTIVNSFNTHITKVVPGQEHVFLSADSVEMGDE